MLLRKTILEQSLWKTLRLHQTRISLYCIIILKKKKKRVKFTCVNRNKVFNTGKVPSALQSNMKVSTGIWISRLGTSESQYVAYRDIHKCKNYYVWRMNGRNLVAYCKEQ